MSEHKYYFFKIFVHSGEYEFEIPYITQTIKPIEEYLDEIVSTYYSGESDPHITDEQDKPEGYYFHTGCVYVEYRSEREIPIGEFFVLKQYIPEM